MTLPRDIHSGFSGNDGIIIKKVPPPPILLSKPTARIVPLSTSNSCDLNTAVFSTNHPDLSDDIATANIKTKISQFEYLASRNFDRCPKFPVSPDKDFFRGGKCPVVKKACQNDFVRRKCVVNSFDLVEEEPEQNERKRLDEILTICAEYEKQAQLEKNVKFSPNRIKTNGSLPRDLRTITTSPDPQHPPSNSPQHNPYHMEISPFTYDVPPNSASSQTVPKQRPIFDFNNIPVKDKFTDLDVLSEQLRKTCAVDYAPRNRIKTTVTTYQDGRSNSPYSTPQSPQFAHLANHFINDTPTYQSIGETSNRSPLPASSFKYYTLPKDTKLVSAHQFGGDNKFSPSDAKKLITMRKDLERTMVGLKAKLSENDSYYEEVVREFELERALLIAEYKTRLGDKRNFQSRQQIHLQKVLQIENIIGETQLSKDNDQIQCAVKLSNAQQTVKDIEAHLNSLTTNKGSNDYQLTFDKYLLAQETLDNERKAFEDLEFHHLEKEADLLASKEELQRELRDLHNKIDEFNTCLADLKSQLDHLTHAHTITHAHLQRNTQQLHLLIDETRNKLKSIDMDMNTNTRGACKSSPTPYNHPTNTASVLKHARDADYSSNGSSGVNSDTEEGDGGDEESDGGSSGSYVLRNGRQNDLGVRAMARSVEGARVMEGGGVGAMTRSVDGVLDGEREGMVTRSEDGVWVRVIEGGGTMTRSVDGVLEGERVGMVIRSEHGVWVMEGEGVMEKKTPSQGDIDRICKVTSSSPMNIIDDSLNLGQKAIESLLEIERNRHIHLVETGSEVIENERRRVCALKQRAQEEVRSEWARRKPEFSSTLNTTEQNSVNISDDENNSKARNSSDNSVSTTKEMDLDSPSSSGNFKRCTVKDKQRPLTRYLPIKSADLDLRQHIVSAGHQVILCPYVTLNSSICKGFLHKKRSKFNNWSRRWFVFDRTKRCLIYYTDKNEKKTRGATYFQAIEDVYLDHSNSIKSPSAHLTFVVKTHQRLFYLMAPSAESMRIWIDVIFTGAEGYCAFGQNI